MKKIPSLIFEKDYWFINDGKPANIELLDKTEDRNYKLKKIIDRINGVEHEYIPDKMDLEWFKSKGKLGWFKNQLDKQTLIPKSRNGK
jgi:hypothetical protein